MEELIKLMSQMKDKDVLNKISQRAGTDQGTTMDVMSKAMPALMKALGENTQDTSKASSLETALDHHGEDNISDLNGFLGDINSQDAQKMLGHILSGKKDQVQQQVSMDTKANANQVGDIMSLLAPMLIGMLANQKKKGNIGIQDIGRLGQRSGQQNNFIMDLATKFFDKDGDGSVMDEAMDFVSKMMKK